MTVMNRLRQLALLDEDLQAIDPSVPNPADLLDVTEAADWIGVNLRTLRSWINAGTLRCWKIGGRRLVLKGELLTMIVAVLPGNRAG